MKKKRATLVALSISNPNRIRLLTINLVLLDSPGHILRRHLAFRGQRRDGGVGDVIAVDFEVAAQVGAGVAAAEAVGAEDGVLHRHVFAELVGEGAHVVRRGDGRALAAFQQLGDVGLARGLGFRVHAVEAEEGSESTFAKLEPRFKRGLLTLR